MSDELDRKHPKLATALGAAQIAASVGDDSGRRGPKHGLREGAGAVGDDSRDTRPDRATRYVETARGTISYTELAPLLAERVATAEADLYREVFAAYTLNESLILDLHARICGDLVPEWAGRWRLIEVRVGKLQPPLPHEVPVHMRDYALDMQARWPDASASPSDLTLELLAFTEGRFLATHPFSDFNGRTIRLFLRELLRRLDFPRVILEPDTDADRAVYFSALEAGDRCDFRPLVDIWRDRLSHAETPDG